MLINSYNLPQLVDLALKVPEVGAVNFNILHTVLITILKELNLTGVQPLCNIENPVAAQAAITSLKLKPSSPLKRSFSDYTIRKTIDDIKSATLHTESKVLHDEKKYEEPESLIRSPSETSTKLLEEPIPERRVEPPSAADIMSGIDTGQQSNLMCEMWRSTNLNMRMEAAEEGLRKLSYVVDRIADRLNQMGSKLSISEHRDTAREHADRERKLQERERERRDRESKRRDKEREHPDKDHVYTDTERLYTDTEPEYPDTEPEYPDTETEHPDTEQRQARAILDRIITLSGDVLDEEADARKVIGEVFDAISTTEETDMRKDEVKKKKKDHIKKSKKTKKVELSIAEMVAIEEPSVQVITEDTDEIEAKVEQIQKIVKHIIGEKATSTHGLEGMISEIVHLPSGYEAPDLSKEPVSEDIEDFEVIEDTKEPQDTEQTGETEEAETIRSRKDIEKDEKIKEPSTERKLEKGEISTGTDFEKVGFLGEESVETIELKSLKASISREGHTILQAEKGEFSSMQIDFGSLSLSKLEEKVKELYVEILRLNEKMNDKEQEEDIQRRIRNLEALANDSFDKFEDARRNQATCQNEIREHGEIIKNNKAEIEKLYINKVSKELLEAKLASKIDRSEFNLRIGRAEFENTVADLGESIGEILKKIRHEDSLIQTLSEAFHQKMKKKVDYAEYDKLQIPVISRIRSLMHAFQNMKNAFLNLLNPAAAGVTKCLSCGRQAELAGTKYKKSGDTRPPRTRDRDFSIVDLKPSDPPDEDRNNPRKRMPGSRSSHSLTEIRSDNHQLNPAPEISDYTDRICRKCSDSLSIDGDNEVFYGSGVSSEEIEEAPRDNDYANDTLHLSSTKMVLNSRKGRTESDKMRYRDHMKSKTKNDFYRQGVEYPTKTRQEFLSKCDHKSFYRGQIPLQDEQSSEEPMHFSNIDLDEEALERYNQSYPPSHHQLRNFSETRYPLANALNRGMKFELLRFSEDPARGSMYTPDYREAMESREVKPNVRFVRDNSGTNDVYNSMHERRQSLNPSILQSKAKPKGVGQPAHLTNLQKGQRNRPQHQYRRVNNKSEYSSFDQAERRHRD